MAAAAGHAVLKGGEFLAHGQGKLALELDGSVAAGIQRLPVQLVVGGSLQRYAVEPSEATNAICYVGSHGQCLTGRPDLSGLIGLVGMRVQPATRVGVVAAIGTGYLGGPATVNSRRNSRASEERVDLTYSAASRVDVGVRLQSLKVDDVLGVQMTTRPVSVLLSLHY